MDSGARPSFDGGVNLLALVKTGCQVRAHKQAPAAHGGESPLGWPLQEGNASFPLLGARPALARV